VSRHDPNLQSTAAGKELAVLSKTKAMSKLCDKIHDRNNEFFPAMRIFCFHSPILSLPDFSFKSKHDRTFRRKWVDSVALTLCGTE